MLVSTQQTFSIAADLRYYVLRGSTMVPLVPVDQLPFQLQGIPRQLSHRQMSDENWRFLVETSCKTPKTIAVQAPNIELPPQSIPPSRPVFLAPDHYVRNQSPETQTKEIHPRKLSHPVSARQNFAELSPCSTVSGNSSESQASALSNSFATIYAKDAQRIGYRVPYPSGVEPDPSKKEYCTYWIKTGECAFTSIGCKYKHEMPTIEKLRELGFSQGLPKWWREKSAIAAKGQTWLQRRLAQCAEKQDVPNSPPLLESPVVSSGVARDDGASNDSVRGHPDLQDSTQPLKPQVKPGLGLPPAPIQTPTTPTISLSNLLIDLEDSPTVTPNPQRRLNSPVGYTSNRTIASETSSPSINMESSLQPTIDFAAMKMAKYPREKSTIVQPYLEQYVQSFSRSGIENCSQGAPKVLKNPRAHRKPSTRLVQTMKHPGLANSKHASESQKNHDQD